MTNLITLTIPNDDHVALRAFGKALEEMARAYDKATDDGDVTRYDKDGNPVVLTRLKAATDVLMQAAPRMMQELRCEGDELQGKRKEAEVDTTAQQLEAFARSQQPLGNEIEIAIKENLHELYLDSEPAAPTTDSTGTPWDERIHSASKALNSDGTWRLRRKPKDMDEAEWSDYVTMIKADLQYPVECGGQEPTLEEGDETVQLGNSSDPEAPLAEKWDGKGENVPEPVRIEPTEQDALDAIKKATNDLNNGVPIAEAVAPLAVFAEPPVTPPGDDFHTDAGVVTEQTVAGIPPIPVPPPVVVPPVPHTIPVTVEVVNDWDFPKLMKFLTERHGKIDVPTVNQLLAVDGLAALTDLNAHPDKIGPFVARVKAHLGE